MLTRVRPGGAFFYDESLIPTALEGFANFTAKNDDKYAITVQFLTFDGNKTVGISSVQYSKPEANPPAFASYDDVQPRLIDTLRFADMKNMTDEVASVFPYGKR